MKTLGFGSALLLCAISLPLSAQRSALSNTGVVRDGPAFGAAQQQAAIERARAEAPGPAGLDRVQLTNLGELASVEFAGHDLTDLSGEAPGDRVLYAPSEGDDPAWRASLSAAMGGAVVDYFDTRVATPSVALLSSYDGVYTWTNYSYFDAVAFGDNLATYCDLGGDVVLGVFCTYTTGYYLDGRIMTPGYSPVVSPTGTNHKATSAYVGDGATCLYDGVFYLDSYYRDVLALQGTGIVDGTYADGEICHAYRLKPSANAGSVVYSNGVGAIPIGGAGDWHVAVGNAVECVPGATGPSILYAPSDPDAPEYRAQIGAAAGTSVVDYFDASFATPTLAHLAQYDVVYTWVNLAYADNVAMGDVLADYVDQGGNVVLGVFCTYTAGYYLDGRIMQPGYSPVYSPTGGNLWSTSAYAGNGSTCIYDGVTALDAFYRDDLAVRSGAFVDGTYVDGAICHAFQAVPPVPGAGTIVYSNGLGVPLGGNGEWPLAVANSGTCIGYGQQIVRNSKVLPQNAWAWLPDPAGAPSISRVVWQPMLDGAAQPFGAWDPPLGPGSIAYLGLFTGPSTLPVSVGGSDPWVLGDVFPPNPVGTYGPYVAIPGVLPLAYPIPQDPALIGGSATTQILVFDFSKPVPFRMTNAIDIVVGT